MQKALVLTGKTEVKSLYIPVISYMLALEASNELYTSIRGE